MTRALRVAIVSSMLESSFGGPPAVVAAHAKALCGTHTVRVFGCGADEHAGELERNLNAPWRVARTWPGWWMRAPGMRQAIEDWRPDIIHSHDVWLHGLYASWCAAKKIGVPIVLTPHGIFTSPWRYSSLHKRIYRKLIFDRMAGDVAAVHVLNRAEAEGCREAGLPDRAIVIPNGIPSAEFVATDRSTARRRMLEAYPQLAGRRVVLYLGRLWSQKGLDILPSCWAAAKRAGWVLLIVGPDYRGYRSLLEREIIERGLVEHVLLLDPVSGDAKRNILSGSDIFILPSHGEGFSMSAIEAIAGGTPCVLTTPCNFPELAKTGGGWECADDQASLTRALTKALTTPSGELYAMGERARLFGMTNYTVEAVADQLSSLYERLVGSAR